ncbi:MAG: hypothetical protein M1530_03310 [Candidatus Marsarchaeota archaeon]|nr:hypothetical protein [Candidatus Marsarchaeota archaeon]
MANEAPDPIASAAKGVTKGALEHFEEKIDDMLRKFRQGELAFIEDERTIEIVRSQRNKPSWKLFRKYVQDPDLRLQIEMGLSLRALEDDQTRLADLRNKILNKFKRPGLHVAELSERGLIDWMIKILLEGAETEEELQTGVTEMLSDVDRYAAFIQAEDDPKKITEKIVVRLLNSEPPLFIILCRGSVAEKNANEILAGIFERVGDYRAEILREPELAQTYIFILRKDTKSPWLRGNE